MMENIEGRRRRGQERIRCLDGSANSMDMSLSKLCEIVKDRKAWHAAIHATKSQTQLSDFTIKTEAQLPKLISPIFNIPLHMENFRVYSCGNNDREWKQFSHRDTKYIKA